MCNLIAMSRVAAVVVAAGLIGCARTEPPPPVPAPDVSTLVQERQAEDRKAREEMAAFTARMQQDFDDEPRDPDWAAAFETELASSYERDRTLPKGALKQVQCRTSRCVLDFAVIRATNPVEAHSAIFAWLTAGQPCGLYVEETGLEVLPEQRFDQRAYLDCER